MDSNHQPKHSIKNGAVNRTELSPSPAVEPDTNGHTGRTEARGDETDGEQASVDAVVESTHEQEAQTPVESAGEVTDTDAIDDTDAVADEVSETVAESGTEAGETIVEGEIDAEFSSSVEAELDTVIDAGTSAEPTDEASGDEASDEPLDDLAETADVEEAEGAPVDAAVAEEDAPAERSALVMNAVKIRGRPGGVAIEIAEGEWVELLEVLQERLDMAEGFFRGGRVVLDLGARAVDEAELQQVVEILAGFEMEMAVVRAEAESTLEAAVALGITTSSGEGEDPLRNVTVSSAETQAEEESAQGPAYYVHQGNLRSGQVLQRAESVIVIGDVNPGAQVISSGDVLIWGRLRGSVHAGAEGDSEAMVTAMEFAPTQLRIADLTSVPPEEQAQSRNFLFWKKNVARGAEFAYVGNGRIYVEPWNAARPGSLTARRRQ